MYQSRQSNNWGWRKKSRRFYFVGPADLPLGNEERVNSFAANIKTLLPKGASSRHVVQLKASDAKRGKHCSGYFSRFAESPSATGATVNSN
jgi:hypothetical protein